MLIISIIIFIIFFLYHQIFLKINKKYNEFLQKINNPKRKTITIIFIYVFLFLLLHIIYSIVEKQADLGIGGVGFANIVVQCIYKSYQSQDYYRKSKIEHPSLRSILSNGAGFLSGVFPTDKTTRHNYIEHYDNYFSKFKNTSINLLEIGIKKGGSIKLWREYFSKDSKIYGLGFFIFLFRR
jgi:hypothetical protein